MKRDHLKISTFSFTYMYVGKNVNCIFLHDFQGHQPVTEMIYMSITFQNTFFSHVQEHIFFAPGNQPVIWAAFDRMSQVLGHLSALAFDSESNIQGGNLGHSDFTIFRAQGTRSR